MNKRTGGGAPRQENPLGPGRHEQREREREGGREGDRARNFLLDRSSDPSRYYTDQATTIG